MYLAATLIVAAALQAGGIQGPTRRVEWTVTSIDPLQVGKHLYRIESFWTPGAYLHDEYGDAIADVQIAQLGPVGLGDGTGQDRGWWSSYWVLVSADGYGDHGASSCPRGTCFVVYNRWSGGEIFAPEESDAAPWVGLSPQTVARWPQASLRFRLSTRGGQQCWVIERNWDRAVLTSEWSSQLANHPYFWPEQPDWWSQCWILHETGRF